MLEFLYKFVTPWAIANKYEILKNRLIGVIANWIYPIYCYIVPLKNMEKNEEAPKIIISLTSFPNRINKIHLCINSLLRQKTKADKVILWLAKEQFENRKLPHKLLNLEKKGLEIRYCDDLRSYKKIFYTAQQYTESIIVTADDDTLYPELWLDNLLRTHEKFDKCVVCYRAHEIIFDENKNISSYSNWNSLSPNYKGPSFNLVAIGVGGILYPSKFFENVEFDFNTIKEICLTTDDLWLKAISMVKGYKVVKVNENSKEWFTIKQTQKIKLASENVDNNNKNDIAMKKLINYYNLNF